MVFERPDTSCHKLVFVPLYYNGVVMNRKPQPIDIAIGQYLKTIRKKHNMSQLKLVELLDYNITQQQIQKYEKGINRISVARLCECLEVLGISLIEFFTEINLPDKKM